MKRYNVIFSLFFSLCTIITSSTIMANPIIEGALEEYLDDCKYNKNCIKQLREDHPDMLTTIDDILAKHYEKNYLQAIDHLNKDGKLKMIQYLQLPLLLDADAIKRGQEGPCLIETHDGSDRGANGLRMKVLNDIKDKIEKS